MKTNCNPVGWFEIYVQDIERAKTFYQNTFDVTLERLESPDMPDLEMWAFPMEREKPGCAGTIVKMSGKDSGCGGTIVYFNCADCAVEAERAAKHGGALENPKFSIGQYGFIAFVKDTEGNVIGLHSMQ